MRNLSLGLLSIALFCGGCSHRKLESVESVNMDRFMGDWWVLANIPSSPEKDCFNSLERYTRREDGGIDVRFSCNVGGFDGKEKVMTARAWVYDKETNAEWRVQFFWPIRFDYIIIANDETDYEWTVVGHPSRDYLWIMARNKDLNSIPYPAILEKVENLGFDPTKIQKVPQY